MKEYDSSGELIEDECDMSFPFQTSSEYDNLPGRSYVDIDFDTYKYVFKQSPNSTTKTRSKICIGHKMCRYIQPLNDDDCAITPYILKMLLSNRKATRKQIPTASGHMKDILEKRQLNYKISANSIYGQYGAPTSTFYDQDIAASTTAIGRKLLMYAKTAAENCYSNRECVTENHGTVITNLECVYGDTDSVFINFNLTDTDGIRIKGKKALEITIELAKQAGKFITKFIKAPHDLEYEKTFMPFILLSRKRYVGLLYEEDVNKCVRKEMGLALKRRDNAEIVKEIYGEIINILMDHSCPVHTNLTRSVTYLNNCLCDLTDEKYPMEKLTISKSLNSFYKNPKQIAHKVLADRITQREPGNKPMSGDRIPYVYIHTKEKNTLQGNKIETPTFVLENNIKIDYAFYITNQIMKPVSQVYGLLLTQIWEKDGHFAKINQFQTVIAKIKDNFAEEKWDKKIQAAQESEVKRMLFDEHIRRTTNKKMGYSEIPSHFAYKK